MKKLSQLFISIILFGYSAISISKVFIDEQISDVEPTAEQGNASKNSNPISSVTTEPDCSLPHNKRCYPRSTATDSGSTKGEIERITTDPKPKN